MKHIGWCLDNIQIAIAGIPKSVDSENNRKKASTILDKVQEYLDTLTKIITNRKFEEYIRRLEDTDFEGIKLQGKEIEALKKDLEHMLYVLDIYLKELRELLKHHPESKRYKAKQILMALRDLINNEKNIMNKECSRLERYRALLRKRMHQFNNKADQIVLMINQKFGGERGDLRKEFAVVIHSEAELEKLEISEKHLEEFLK